MLLLEDRKRIIARLLDEHGKAEEMARVSLKVSAVICHLESLNLFHQYFGFLGSFCHLRKDAWLMLWKA